MVARFNRLSLGERENRGPIGAECWLECSEKQGQLGWEESKWRDGSHDSCADKKWFSFTWKQGVGGVRLERREILRRLAL